MGAILADSSRLWRKKTRDERKQAVCQQYARAFQCDAMLTTCREYIELDWSTEKFSGGCYGDIMPKELLTSLREELRAPCNNQIFFAGTELATRWTGYMDGAVQAGERAAFEIITKYWESKKNQEKLELLWIEEEPVHAKEDCRPSKDDKLIYGPSRLQMMLPRASTVIWILKATLVFGIGCVAFSIKYLSNRST
ncbi:unnamed protein product [Adineta steineri]|nr:unnamed protein product [Adineta steineri]